MGKQSSVEEDLVKFFIVLIVSITVIFPIGRIAELLGIGDEYWDTIEAGAELLGLGE